MNVPNIVIHELPDLRNAIREITKIHNLKRNRDSSGKNTVLQCRRMWWTVHSIPLCGLLDCTR